MPRTPFMAKRATESDRDSIVQLASIVWGSNEAATHEYFQWHCCQDHTGRSITHIVKDHSNHVISYHTLLPVPAVLNGKRILTGFSILTGTHPDYRRQGLNTLVTSSIYEEAKELGINPVFVLPNSMSSDMFAEKFGFSSLGRPKLLVRWLDPGVFLGRRGFPRVGRSLSAVTKIASRIRSGYREQTVKPRILENLDGLRVDKIWEPIGFCIAADSDWLRWRYKEHPTRRYEIALIGEVESPQALVVYQVMELYKQALVMEFFVARGTRLQAVQALMDSVAEKCKAAGCSGLWCLGTPNSRKSAFLKKSDFWGVPFNSVWRPDILFVKKSRLLPFDFSVSTVDFSYGTLINFL